MSALGPGLKVGKVMNVGLVKEMVFQMFPGEDMNALERETNPERPAPEHLCVRMRVQLTVAVATEGSHRDLRLGAGPVGVPDHHPPHRQVVSEVQVALIGEPESHIENVDTSHRRELNLLRVFFLPLSVVGVAVALKLGVSAGLVDGAAAHLDLPERPSPVVVTLVVPADPVAKRSSI